MNHPDPATPPDAGEPTTPDGGPRAQGSDGRACLVRVDDAGGPASRAGRDRLERGVRRRLNGVPVDQLAETVAAIDADPTLGEARFRLQNRWIGGAFNRSIVQAFYAAGEEDASRLEPFILDSDEPPVLLGDNRGAHPMEYLLHGLIGCITSAFVYLAAAEGVEVREIASTVEGRFDLRAFLGVAPVDAGYEEIRIEMRVKSDAPAERIRELIGLAERRSPVFGTVTNSAPVTVNVTVS